jgi:sec-independent protein translocase protein TatB
VFDISFSELMIIAVVALIVIGPEKLPKVARTLGAFAGKAQRLLAQVKEEVNREARFEELQKLQQEVEATASQFKTHVADGVNAFASSVEKNPSSDLPPKPKVVRKPRKVKAPTESANLETPVKKRATRTKATKLKNDVDS